MSTAAVPLNSARRSRTPYAVTRALAVSEMRRTLRNPVLPLGAAVSLWYLWSITAQSESWSGSAYSELAIASGPLLLAISWVSAVSFHRERTPVAMAAPVRAGHRAVARLVATTPLVGMAVGFATLMAWRERALGGLTLGAEPGQTSEALHSVGELGQHVALALLAIALGAALGRRVSRLALALPLLLVFWFAVAGFYWLFGHRAVAPFSVVLVQPVSVPVGPANADPLAFPARWLLEAPGEFRDGWTRLFVSSELAWWHNGWLLGLALLLIAATLPGGATRRRVMGVGFLVAALCAAAQTWMIP